VSGSGIEMPYQVVPVKHVLGGGARRRCLPNATERSVLGGDTALCQITLTLVFLILCHFCEHRVCRLALLYDFHISRTVELRVGQKVRSQTYVSVF